MNVGQVHNTEIIGLHREIIRREADFFRDEEKTGFEQGIEEQQNQQNDSGDQPAAAVTVTHLVTTAATGGRRVERCGRNMLSAIGIQTGPSFSLTA